jgi:peptide deformylase
MVKAILLLGDEQLYEKSEEVQRDEDHLIERTIIDLHDTLMDYRESYGAGRAIAAPQIGVKKRIIYMFIEKPVVFINPSLEFHDSELMDVLDDCMSFPGLFVNLKRHKRCAIKYYDENWERCTLELEGDLSELLQHEYDHLDGILATMRAVNNQSFVLKSVGKIQY